MSAIPAL